MLLSARYAVLLTGWNGEVDPEFQRKTRMLRALCQDIVELRRGDQNASWLRLDLDKFADTKQKADDRALDLLLAQARQWPEVLEALRHACALHRKRQQGGSGSTTTPLDNQTESNQIKP